MATCPKCNGQISDTAKFCKHCGNKIEQKPQFIFCEECGAKIEANAPFCEECGAKVGEAQADDPWGEFDKPKNDDPWASFADYKEPETIVVEKIVEKPVEVIVEKPVALSKPATVSASVESDYQAGVQVLNNYNSVKKNTEAAKLIKQKADTGDYEACIKLSVAYMRLGKHDQAKQVIQNAVNNSYAPALNQLGEICWRTKEYDLAEKAFCQAVDNGYANAYFLLAQMQGSVKNDYVARFKYHKKGAEANCAACMRELANAHWFGEGCTKDQSKYKPLVMKAAEMGDSVAQWWVGCSYFKGERGFELSVQKANEWFKKSAKNPVNPVEGAKRALKGDYSWIH